MTEVDSLLDPRLSSDPDTKRYFLSLLSKSLPKLERERSLLNAESLEIERKLDVQAVNQSKICFNASVSMVKIKEKCVETENILKSALKTTENAKNEAENSEKQSILVRIRYLKAVKSQQAAISELLEIPAVLHTLHSAGMYEEMLKLLRYTKALTRDNTAPLMEKLRNDALEFQTLLERSIQSELASSLDFTRTTQVLKYLSHRLISELLSLSSSEMVKLYLKLRYRYFTNHTDHKQPANTYLLTYISTLEAVLETIIRDTAEFGLEERSTKLFFFDRVLELMEVWKGKVAEVEKISDLKKIWTAVERLDREVLLKSGFGVGKELFGELVRAYASLVTSQVQRTQQNFESMLRLYQWDNTSQKDPLLKFGGISVLYNNCIYILNEVRSFPLSQVSPTLTQSLSSLLLSVSLFVLNRGQHLHGPGPRTPQQNVYRSLFFDMVETLRKYAFPALISALSDTFPDQNPSSDCVSDSQTKAMDVLNEVEISNS